MERTTRCEQTIVSRLRAVCTQHPDAVALEHAGVTISYGDMWQRTDALALYLRQQMSVRRGDCVGICIDSNLNMILALIATFKAGAYYVPLDADLPKHRLQYMAAETRPKVILTQRKYSIDMTMAADGIDGLSILLMDQDLSWQRAVSVQLESEEVQPNDLAYVIYTSGSTGEPKGVMVEHAGLLNLALANVAAFEIDGRTRLIQFASLSFDAAAWEIFSVLAGAGTLVLGSKEDMIPGRALGAFLAHKQVTMICIAPSLLATLTSARDDLPCLRTVVVAGEACPVSVVRDWAGGGRTLWNAYGPTEATVCATMHRFAGDEQTAPIGVPLPGVSVYLVNEAMQQVPPGQAGELCIGGIGVARGYLHKPALSSAVFVANPWGPGRLYRTGDIAVQHEPGGVLEFVGRRDDQVKVHGFRVELGAIENALGSHPAILSAAVIATELVGYGAEPTRSLVGYFVARPGADPDLLTQESLARFLDQRLPNFMVPPVYVALDAMPMMPNRSKIDRSALPLPSTRRRVVTPNSTRATEMAALFDQALGLPLGTFDVQGHFFEMGGNSMAVAHLILAIKTEFGIRMPARQIYQHPTPASLMRVVDAMLASPYRQAAAEVVDVREAAYKEPWPEPQAPAATGPMRSVLLTGANGFLGSFLLVELLRMKDPPRIYCLVRADSDVQAQQRLTEQLAEYGLASTLPETVQVLAGDLRDKQMALSEERYATLAQDIDTVFHCGADVNHLKPYAALRAANVDGTRHALRFAFTARTKRFHFASTLGVTGSADILLGIHHIPEDYDIEQSVSILDIENGYTKSKWVAERVVQQAADLGLPVTIHRTGFLTGSTQTGAVKLSDLMSRLVVGCIQLGCYPYLPRKYWCPIPVDFVAQAMATVAVRELRGPFQWVVDRDKEPSHLDLFRMINDLGFPVRAVDPAVWFEALATCKTDNALYPVTPFLLEKVHEGRNTILEVHYRSATCGNQLARQALAGSDIAFPAIDAALMRRYLDYFVRTGLLPEAVGTAASSVSFR